MDHAKIAGMKPAALKGLLCGQGVTEIALHHDVSAEHNLAHRLAVAWDRLQCLRVQHIKPFQRQIAPALA